MRFRFAAAFSVLFSIQRLLAMEPQVTREYPFEYKEGLIWVQIQVRESKTPLNFLLDSGARLSVIHLPTLQRIGRLRGRRIPVRGVETISTGYWPEHLSVSEGSLPLPKDLVAVDLTEFGRTCAKMVDGLLGEDFFRAHIVQIDFAARKIRLLPSLAAASSPIVLPLETDGSLRVAVTVNGSASQRVRLDTGCAAGLHWATCTIRPDQCKPQFSVALSPLNVPMTQTTVQIGPCTLQSVSTGIHKKPIFPQEDGLLGNEVLARFASITIDVRDGRVLLQSGT